MQLIQKSCSGELTLEIIPYLKGSLVGFMYLTGGIKPGVNSLACALCGARIRQRSRCAVVRFGVLNQTFQSDLALPGMTGGFGDV